VGFKELYQMFRLVTEQVGQEPIIIDADDLLKQPGMHLPVSCFITYDTYDCFAENNPGLYSIVRN